MQDLTERLDYNVIFLPYLASKDAGTLDAIFRDKDAQLEHMVIFAEDKYI
jgi:hypothetical protein